MISNIYVNWKAFVIGLAILSAIAFIGCGKGTILNDSTDTSADDNQKATNVKCIRETCETIDGQTDGAAIIRQIDAGISDSLKAQLDTNNANSIDAYSSLDSDIFYDAKHPDTAPPCPCIIDTGGCAVNVTCDLAAKYPYLPQCVNCN